MLAPFFSLAYSANVEVLTLSEVSPQHTNKCCSKKFVSKSNKISLGTQLTQSTIQSCTVSGLYT